MPSGEPGGRHITLIYKFSGTFMFVLVLSGCLSLYGLLKVRKAFLLGCFSVKHQSEEENEWHAAGIRPKATVPPTPQPPPKTTPNKGHLYLLALKAQMYMNLNH